MMKLKPSYLELTSALAVVLCAGQANALTLPDSPLNESLGSSSMVMMTLGRDHTLSYEAYNDLQDIYNAKYLTEIAAAGKTWTSLSPEEQTYWISKPDGIVDNRYITDPNFKYYGYFENNRCYTYTGATTWNPTSYSASDKLFSPTSTPTTDKKCSGQWSGDFLNYLTMTRIDILRKALYGGMRDTDTSTESILQRSYIPQDSHAFGKEYDPKIDQFDIHDYTPLPSLPSGSGLRHLFSSVTLAQNSVITAIKPPSLQVLTNSKYRIWDWVSIERPIAGTKCVNGEFGDSCEAAGSTKKSIAQVSNTTDFNNEWDKSAISSASIATANVFTSAGIDNKESDDNYFLEVTGFLDLSSKLDIGNLSSSIQITLDNVDDSAELFLGNLALPVAKVYDGYSSAAHHSVTCAGANGTDVSGATAGNDGDVVSDRCFADIVFGASDSVNYSADGANPRKASVSFTAATMASFANATKVPFKLRYLENTGGDGVKLMYKDTLTTKAMIPASMMSSVVVKKYINQPPASTMSAYVVRVKVCDKANDAYGCAKYGTNYKPEGLLQDYDKNDGLLFGLLTGSYSKNRDGGVLRKRVSKFATEVNSATGQFNSVDGVVKTLNAIRVSQLANTTGKTFNYPEYADCSVTGSGAGTVRGYTVLSGNKIDPNIPNDKTSGSADDRAHCKDWGNPIAEMMYESLRYLEGSTTTAKAAASATSAFSVGNTEMFGALPVPPSWDNPFTTNSIDDSSCVQPYNIVVSDINPSYDFDLSSLSTTLSGYPVAGGPATNLDVDALDDLMWNAELGAGSHNVFVGYSSSATIPAGELGTPTAKSASSFSEIHGPWREAFNKGSYHAGAVAYFGQTHKLANFADGSTKAQPVKTMAVVMSSVVPQIEVPLRSDDLTKTIKLIPFARTVEGINYSTYVVNSSVPAEPANQIADFYFTEPLQDKDPNDKSKGMTGQFVVGYENLQQGADFDMDMRVTYQVETFPSLNKLTISLNSGNTSYSYTNLDGVSVNLPAGAAYGTLVQHAGIVVSGAKDTVKGSDGLDYKVNGPHLFVRDCDTLLNKPDNCRLATTTDDRSSHPLYMSRNVGTPGSISTDYGGKFPKQPLTWTLNVEYPATGAAASTDVLLKDPLWYAAKWGNFDDTNSNSKPDLVSEWDKVNNDTQTAGADGTPDGYFFAKNPGLLPNQLANAFRSIKPPAGFDKSGGGVAVSSGVYDPVTPTNNMVFKTKYRSKGADWIGDVVASQFKLVGSNVVLDDTLGWSAATLLDALPLASRKVYTTRKTATGFSRIDFDYDNLTANQQTSIDSTAATAKNIISYLKGDTTNEGTLFRDRSSRLGDIVDSQPVWVGAPSMLYGTDGYPAFRTDPVVSVRAPTLYVGANDGMLHAFNAINGSETFAFTPAAVMHKLKGLSLLTNFNHKFFVNGPMVAVDARLGTATGSSATAADWSTVLVSAMGAGAKGYFALDVTDPSNMKVLWEFTDATWNYDAINGVTMGQDLGYSFSKASVVQLNTGDWAAIFGNGYNSVTGRAVLYVVRLKDGQLLSKLEAEPLCSTVGCSGTNGLSTITAVDLGSKSGSSYDNVPDGKVDMVFAGDLKGNVWQFDLGSTSTTAWSVVDHDTLLADPQPLFVAKSPSSGNPVQPITSQIMVSRLAADPIKGNKVQLSFGTGQYLELNDKTSSTIQSLYSIRAFVDGSGKGTPVVSTIGSRKLFKVKTALATYSSAGVSTTVRTAESDSGSAMSWDESATTGQGWYMDLVADSSAATLLSRNERVAQDPRLPLETPTVQFSTLMPIGTTCDSGNKGAVIRLCLYDGTTSCASKKTFDLNNDLVFDASDLLASGSKEAAGIEMTRVNADKSIMLPSSGGTSTMVNLTTDENAKAVRWQTQATGIGRQSWRNVR